ncbi:MAG: hypothetical protein FWG61_01445 [Firmicutes bacterium]|nr:hypothetical protein [Bacillota bacterium]
MLGKLIKYELKGTAHYFLPLIAAILILSLIFSLFGSLYAQWATWISGLMIFVEVVLIIALAVMTLVITIQRFYKNLLGDEGYLMFSLPVSTHYNILSKLLVATLWNIAVLLAVTLSIGILVMHADIAGILQMAWQQLTQWLNMSNFSILFIILEWIVVGLISVAGNILLLYLAMAIGQLANEHKFLASFGAYIALQCALGILTALLAIIIPFHFTLDWLNTFSPVALVHIITLAVAADAIIGGTIYYFLTHWLLKRKLNLT